MLARICSGVTGSLGQAPKAKAGGAGSTAGMVPVVHCIGSKAFHMRAQINRTRERILYHEADKTDTHAHSDEHMHSQVPLPFMSVRNGQQFLGRAMKGDSEKALEGSVQ